MPHICNKVICYIKIFIACNFMNLSIILKQTIRDILKLGKINQVIFFNYICNYYTYQLNKIL